MKKIQTKITKLPESMVEIEGVLTQDIIADFKKESLEHFGNTLDLKGFRKGHVPQDVIEKTVGEMAILEDSAERAISSNYPEIVATHQIYPLGRPEIIFTKLAIGNDAEFKIKTAIMPEVTLPDYKKIATDVKEDGATEVTDEEVDKVVEDLRQCALSKMHTKESMVMTRRHTTTITLMKYFQRICQSSMMSLQNLSVGLKTCKCSRIK
jgi:trigger factor